VTLRLAIEAELCGPISIGTVAVIRLVREHFALSLGDAVAVVNRCVFEEEQVVIDVSPEAAERFLRAIRALPASPRVWATILD
jgi:hypothetical protein